MRPALSDPTLVLDAAGGAGWLAVLDGSRLLVRRDWSSLRDATARLSRLTADALAEAGSAAGALSCVVVVVGPGSFTGLRASIAFARGLALATSAALVCVTADEAAGDDGNRTPASAVAAAAQRRTGRLPPLPPYPVYPGPAQTRAASVRPAPA